MPQKNPHTLVEQAQALIRTGNFTGAREIYEQICRLDRDNTDAWMTLGAVHGQLGDMDQAVACLRQAIVLRPDFPEAHYNLGYILRGHGEFQKALAHFEQAVAAKPDYFEALLMMGATNVALHEFGKSEACFRKAIALRPDSLDAQMSLGRSLMHQDKAGEAELAFRKAVQIKPDSAEVLVSLGYACQIGGKHEVAIAHWRQALRLKPDSYEAYLGIGKSMLSLGKPDEARTHCEKATKLNPNPVDAIVEMASIAHHSGDIDKAHELLLPLMESGVKNIQAAIVFANTCKERGQLRDGLVYVERVLTAKPRMNATAWRRALFNLGKLYDAAGDYDRAFDYYRQANTAKQCSFDAERHRAETDAFMSFHTPECMARLPRASVRSERPIFVVGMMRSGTTLIEQILSSHPAVFGANELPDIVNIAHSMPAILNSNTRYPQCLSQLTQEKLDELALAYLKRLGEFSMDAARIVDKAPVNFRHLGLIELMFPDARVIHCMRDPRDSCLSNYFHDYVHSHGYSYDLSNLGSFYRDYRRVMRHWRGILNIALLEVQYEELVANPEVMIRRIVSFCGLEWNDRCLSFHKNERYVNTPSYDQVRQPMYSKSAGRWKNYEHHLGPLIEALGDEIESS